MTCGAARTGIASHATAITLGFIGMTMFSGTLPATRVALEGFDAVFITMGRAVLAAMAAGAALAVLRPKRPQRADLWRIAAIASCLVVGFPLLSGFAMKTVSAGHGGVVLAIMPIATAVAATIVGGERPGLWFWLLGAAGAVLVLVFTLSDAGWRVEPGDIFLLAAAVVAGFGYAFSGKLARALPGWSVIAWALVLSLPFTVAGSIVSAPAVWPQSAEVWAGFAYLGLFSMFLGFAFWNMAMAIGGIAKIGQIQLLQPFVTIAIAAAFTDETIVPRQLIFAAAVVVVVAAAQRMRVGEAVKARPDG